MVIKAREVKKDEGLFVEGMITKDAAGNQLRQFICKLNDGSKFYPVTEIPSFTSSLEAAKWIRKNGHTHLTNQSFKGLVSDMVGHMIGEEEAVTVRVLTGSAEHHYRGDDWAGFTTKEETEELLKRMECSDVSWTNINITETVLGDYVEVKMHKEAK